VGEPLKRNVRPLVQFVVNINRLIFASSLFIITMLAGCHDKAPGECKQLCSLREAQQYRTFKAYPVEKQFDLYVNCANEKSCMRDSESPHDYYGQWMAEDNKAAPFLVERLKSEKDERVQLDIIYVLRFMAVNGHLRAQHQIAEVVNQVAAAMKGSFVDRLFGDNWNVKQSREWAKEIEANTR
jgi:hypothetical protein